MYDTPYIILHCFQPVSALGHAAVGNDPEHPPVVLSDTAEAEDAFLPYILQRIAETGVLTLLVRVGRVIDNTVFSAQLLNRKAAA